MEKKMMACGHVSNGVDRSDGQPVCLIHAGLTPEAKIVVGDLDLTGRTARCGVDHGERPSSTSLAFFEYRGEGSAAASLICGNCGYYQVAHEPPKAGEVRVKSGRVCDEFVPHGPYEFDLYYCGCRGWD